MTPDAFLKLALSLPDAELSSHMDRGDIRVRGRIFSSPADREGGAAILKLTPDQQTMLCTAEPKIFEPVPGGWGRQGWTRLIVSNADTATAKSALWTAWRNVAPKTLQDQHKPS